jgi:hypothetical protein
MPTFLIKTFNHLLQSRYSLRDVMLPLAYYVALECGFISKRIDQNDFKDEYTWYYANSSQVLKHLYQDNNDYDLSDDLELKFVMDPASVIVVKCHEISGDFALIAAYQKSSSKIHCCENVILSFARFMPFKKLVHPIPSSFRHLKELSIMLKENIFLPLRNEIYRKNQKISPYLNGMPDHILAKIYSFLNHRDRCRLRNSCKAQKEFTTRANIK